MKLKCVECKEWHNIPDDKLDDYNIYRKWNGKGSAVMCALQLLCRKCTDKFVDRADKKMKEENK